MSAAGPPWLELVVPAPADRQPALVRDVVGPWLRAEQRAGAIQHALFLREPGDPGRRRLIVQARDAAGATGAALRRLAPGGAAEVGPATVVPLHGSAFAGPALADLARGFLAAVTPTLVALTPPAAAAASTRLSAALDLMAAHLPALGPPALPDADRVSDLLGGAPISVLSLRSHADAFIATSRDPAATRRALDERFETVRGGVQQRITAIFEQLDGRGPVRSTAAARWHDAVVAARPGIVQAVEGGHLTVTDDVGDPAAFTASRFHTAAAASPRLQDFLHTDPRFVATRLLTSLLYLSLHHLGLSLAERYFLCHATSRACESLFGLDPVAVLAGLARS